MKRSRLLVSIFCLLMLCILLNIFDLGGSKNTAYAAFDPVTSQRIVGGFDFAIALLSDNTLKGWGDNNVGQLSPGTSLVESLSPIAVPGISCTIPLSWTTNHLYIKQVVASGQHVLVLMSDDTVWGWGSYAYGEVGFGSVGSGGKLNPVQVLSGVKKIAAGGHHSFAITNNGNLMAWGSNLSSEFGTGIVGTTISSPALVNDSGMQPLANVVDVVGGSSHVLVLTDDGTTQTVLACGGNGSGQLGQGNTTPLSYFKLVISCSRPTTITQIACNSSASYALLSTGTLKGWETIPLMKWGLSVSTRHRRQIYLQVSNR